MSAVPNFSEGGTWGAPNICLGRIVAAVAPVADLARKLRRVFLQGVFFMSEEVGEGFIQKVGFS